MGLVCRGVVGSAFESADIYADHFHKYSVLSDFDNAIVGDEDAIGACYAFEDALFARYDNAGYVAATVENHVAYVSEFLTVCNVYNCLFAEFLKRILPIVHTVHTIFYSRARIFMMLCNGFRYVLYLA